MNQPGKIEFFIVALAPVWIFAFAAIGWALLGKYYS